MRVVVGAAGRADRVLLQHLGDASRRLVAQAFAEGRVRVNGRRARKGDAVAAGDILELDGEVARAALAPAPEPDRPLEVVFQDEYLVAVSKPPGMPSLPLRAGERGTLANALAARFPECVAAGADAREAGLAHRLDAGTSGLLLAARRADVWQALRAAFRAGEVKKEYLALVEGAVEERLVVDAPIAHDRSGAGGVRAGERPGALRALTESFPRNDSAATRSCAASHAAAACIRYGHTSRRRDTHAWAMNGMVRPTPTSPPTELSFMRGCSSSSIR